MNSNDKKYLLEKLSELEHEQWLIWAKNILETENISDETKQRWQKYFVPYKDLQEDIKTKDRIFAQKSLEIFDEYLNNKMI